MFLWKHWSDQGEDKAVDENSTMVKTLLLSSLSIIDLGNSRIDWWINLHTRNNENMRSFDTEGPEESDWFLFEINYTHHKRIWIISMTTTYLNKYIIEVDRQQQFSFSRFQPSLPWHMLTCWINGDCGLNDTKFVRCHNGRTVQYGRHVLYA